MKKLNKKSLVLLACVALLLTCSVGSTVAFLADKADEVVNTFTPTHLSTDVVESFDGTTKSSIKIQNNGNIDAYVRVAIYGNWVITEEIEGEKVDKIVAPWNGTISYNTADWDKGEDDGYYYYKKPLPPTPDGTLDLTNNLLAASITQPTDGPAGAHLVITVIHQSIQAEPISTVKTVWQVNATEVKDENGNFLYYAISK